MIAKRPLLDLAEVVRGATELFSAGEPYILISPWPTGDLTAVGLQLVGHPPLMVRPTSAPGRSRTACS